MGRADSDEVPDATLEEAPDDAVLPQPTSTARRHGIRFKSSPHPVERSGHTSGMGS